VRVVHGHTDRIGHGVGAHASRATVMIGSATQVAALKVRAKALEIAAELLQTNVDALDIVDGMVVRDAAVGETEIPLGDIAGYLAPTSKKLGDREPELRAEGWFHTDHKVFSYGVLIVMVRIDRETGQVAIERSFIAFEVGRAINPMLCEGQIVGGFAQGLGGALLEEFLYDERGEPLSVTFADYLLPTLHDVPSLEVLITEDAPSPHNPLGMKAIGEAGITGVGAVIASAIDDALDAPGAVTQLPVTPQRLREIIKKIDERHLREVA
jgi:carbon-monoxide dehydrogenase large subunit/6-hydroxypseudooxynicotine dehydrogenase subunit gamma